MALRRHLSLSSRTDAEELLDSGHLTREEVDANLSDLARLNRLPGGVRTSIRAIRWPCRDARPLHVLDVGVGAGDMPRAFAGEGWRVTGVDTNPTVLEIARRRVDGSGVTLLEGDARALPFADGTFDVAHASLLLHHFSPADAVRALSEMARVARIGVVVNDLRRGLFPLVASMAPTVAFARSRVTRADALASARRAYSIEELDQLLHAAGLRVGWRSFALMPRVATAAVRA